jgi:Cu(I)/Ag(I) efflux system membrane fusion protein
MAIVRWALVALMAVAAVGAWSWYAAQAGAAAPGTSYHCPMHATIVAAQKGECPICGMDLVPVGRNDASGAHHPGEGDRAGADAAAPPGLAPVELGADQIQRSGIATAPAMRERLAVKLRAPGTVGADEDRLVSVSTRFSGYIESVVAAETGQTVRRGDVLARIFSPDLAGAQQAYVNAVSWAEKRPTIVGPNTAPDGDLRPEARARLEKLGVAPEDIEAIAASRRPLPALSVRAPVSGHVVRGAALKGLFAPRGLELYRIADLSKVWVVADVYETEVGRVRVGQRASFEVAAYPGQRFDGTVSRVRPSVDPRTRTLQARLEVQNPGLRLRPGMSGEVTLELGAGDAIVVPRDAVLDTGAAQYVFVAKDGGRFEPRSVKAGRSDGDHVAVEGLAEGERVVTAASFLVDAESRLRAAVQGL